MTNVLVIDMIEEDVEGTIQSSQLWAILGDTSPEAFKNFIYRLNGKYKQHDDYAYEVLDAHGNSFFAGSMYLVAHVHELTELL